MLSPGPGEPLTLIKFTLLAYEQESTRVVLMKTNLGRVRSPVADQRRAHMPIKDILLPLVGEPSAAAMAAIGKCMAATGDMGARVTAWPLNRIS
jgi:hypothetical protein